MEKRRSLRKRFKCPLAIKTKMPRFKRFWHKVQRRGSRCRKTCQRRFIIPLRSIELFVIDLNFPAAIGPQQQGLHEQTSLPDQQLPVLVRNMTLALDPKRNHRSAISVIVVGRKGIGFKIVPKMMTLLPLSASVLSESLVFPGVSSRL